MEQEERNTGNRLIAEFMGKEVKHIAGQGDFAWVWKKREFKRDYKMPDGYNIMTIPKERLAEISEDKWYNIEDFIHGLKYDRSWDWLMPVVGKIGTINFDMAHGMREWMRENWSDDLRGTGVNLYTPKQELWEAVVKFITWYNQNKKQ